MSERYQKLYSLENNLYTAGSPVLIAAAVLLRDSYGKNLLAQVKLKNIGPRVIKAVKVAISMRDTTGAPLGQKLEHQYLDLNAARDDEFAQKSAVVLPNANARSYTIEVTEAVFEDGGTWLSAGGEWTPLKKAETLEEALGDGELAEQYRIRYGADCKYQPAADGGLWLCACGAVNSASEANCHRCRRAFTALRDVSRDSLKLECAKRLKTEGARQSEDEDAALRLRRKRRRLALILIPALIAVVVLTLGISTVVSKSAAYGEAEALMNAHRYEEAAAAFTALGSYKDSAEQAEKNVPYQKALYIMQFAAADDSAGLETAGLDKSAMSGGKSAAVLLYENAMERFAALGGYKDSAKNAELCRSAIEQCDTARLQAAYDEAKALLESGSYCRARDAFKKLGSYSDSADMAKEAIYRKAMALYGFIEKYDAREIYASISTETDRESIFSLPKATALALGTESISALRSACGGDKADIRLTDTPDSALSPLTDCLSQLFASLGKYSDSAKYVANVADAADYTREFYGLCESGDIYGAYDWLTAYDGEFEDRERWLGMLEMYKPFCSLWQLYMGDASLIPLTAGFSEPCAYFSSCVVISGDTATLRLTVTGGEEYTLDFPSALGEKDFINNADGVFNYYVAISSVDHLAYMKYDAAGKLRSSCEYERAG